MKVADLFVDLHLDDKVFMRDVKRVINTAAKTEIPIKMELDNTQLKRDVQKSVAAAGREGQKTGKSAGLSIGKGMIAGFAAAGIGTALKKAVDSASDLQESGSKMRVIFGDAAKEIEKFSTTSATSLGMSKQAAYDAASMMATFGKAAGLTGQDLTKFSTEMVALSGDLASFFNSSPDEAIEAIGAALRGEAEPIRKYGVLLDDATLKNRALEMGIISTIKTALTPQQKALAAQAEIMAQTSDAQGDFARTSDGLANSQRIMQASLSDASAALGESLLPVMTAGVKIVGSLAEAFNELPSPVRNTAVGLGLTVAALVTLAPAATSAIKGIKGISDSIKAYTTVTTGATVATDALTASSIRLGGTASVGAIAKLSLALGALVTAAGLGVTAVVKLKGAIDNDSATREAARIDGLAKSYLGAITAGESLNTVLTYNVLGADVTGAGMEHLAQQVAKFGPEAESAKLSLAALDSALAAADPDSAARAFDDLRTAFSNVGVKVEDVNAMFPSYIALQKESAGAADGMTAAEKEKTEAIKASNTAQQTAIDLVTDYVNAQLGLAASDDDLLGAEDRLAKTRKDNVEEFTKGKREATEAEKKHATTLKGTSALAIENRDALRSEVGMVLANAKAKIDAAKASGKDTVAAYAIGNKAIKEGRASLQAAAEAAGYNKGQVKNLLDEYLKLPKDVETKVKATGVTAAEDAVAAYKSMLDKVPATKRTQFVATYNKLKNMDLAGGGLVRGPGTGTSDSIPAMLSDGEFVMKASAVHRIGAARLSQLNNGFAQGGLVSIPRLASGGSAAAAAKKALAKRKAAAKKAAAKRKAAAKERSDNRAQDAENIFDFGYDALDQTAQLASLNEQLKGTKKYSDKWVELREKKRQLTGDIAEAAADQAKEAADAAREAAEAAAEEAAEVAKAAAEVAKAQQASRDAFSFMLNGDEFNDSAASDITPGANFKGIIGGIVNQAKGMLEIGAITKEAFDKMRGTAVHYLDQLEATQVALDSVNKKIDDQTKVLDDAKAKLAEATAAYDDFVKGVKESITAMGNFAGMDDGVQRQADATNAVTEAQDRYNKTLATYGANSANTAAAQAALTAAQGKAATSALTGSEIVATVQKKLADVKSFVANVKKLAAMGLGETALREIIAMGPTQGAAFAQALATSSPEIITALNEAQKELASVGQEFGQSAAGFFGLDKNVAAAQLGVDIAQGILDGLNSQKAELEAQMKTLGEAMAAAFKAALGIASPSKVFEEMGVNIPLGIQKGISKQVPDTVELIDDLSGRVKKAGPQRGGDVSATVMPSGVGVVIQGGVHLNRDVDIDTLTHRLSYWSRQSGRTR